MNKSIIVAGAAYALAAIIAYGHFCAETSKHHDKYCTTVQERIVREDCYGVEAITGLIVGAAWPLYLSWKVWEEAGNG